MRDATRGVTPTPWRVEPCTNAECWCAVIDSNVPDSWIAPTGCVSKADAEHIVRCVNAHDAMLAALEAVDEYVRLYEMVEFILPDDIVNKLRDAIRSARGDT